MEFNTEATRWLGVYLDTGLRFKAHKLLTLENARSTEDRIQRLEATRGLALELVRRIQVAAVQAVTVYGAEVW